MARDPRRTIKRNILPDERFHSVTVAKFIAYHHSGGFQIESRPGEGTTVTMVIPLAE